MPPQVANAARSETKSAPDKPRPIQNRSTLLAAPAGNLRHVAKWKGPLPPRKRPYNRPYLVTGLSVDVLPRGSGLWVWLGTLAREAGARLQISVSPRGGPDNLRSPLSLTGLASKLALTDFPDLVLIVLEMTEQLAALPELYIPIRRLGPGNDQGLARVLGLEINGLGRARLIVRELETIGGRVSDHRSLHFLSKSAPM